MKIKEEQRPICSCGAKMTLVQYRGYYDTFNYWCCEKCELDEEMQDFKPDKVEHGEPY